MIGVLGSNGHVGSLLANMLKTRGYELRLGSRSTGFIVDVSNHESLTKFLNGCSVVINCAGPAYLLSEPVARAAISLGIGYLDVAGCEKLCKTLSSETVETPVVFSAGMVPGLSGLLLKLAILLNKDRSVVGFAGGVQDVSPGAAADLVLSMSDAAGYGNNGSVWCDGAVCELDHTPVRAPSCFPGGTSCRAFLSEEARNIAKNEAVPRLEWYNAFAGDLFLKALVDAQLSKTRNLDEASKKISLAASIDAVGKRPFYILAAISGENAYIVRTTDSYELTAAVACYAAERLLAGIIPNGVFNLPDLFEPESAVREILSLSESSRIEITTSKSLFEVEEGEL